MFFSKPAYDLASIKHTLPFSEMTTQRPNPTTVSEHLAGSKDSWHGSIRPDGPFKPEKGRYHLYIGLFCPFAHRANLIRHLKGLQDVIPVSIVRPYPKGDSSGWPGWQFNHPENGDYEGATVDHLFGSKYMHEVYFRADPHYKGRYSVPALWDKQTNTIVNNESSNLMRDLQTCFNDLLASQMAALSFYPEHLCQQIDQASIWMQRDLNTGVYKAGFAPDQATYDKNVIPVFAALNECEKLLARSDGPYLLGKDLTELDIRLYATAVRFDTVYVQHFKCNLATIRHDYPNINMWLLHLYWTVPGFRETTDFRHIKENYTKSHGDINPKGITPMGPYPDVEVMKDDEMEKWKDTKLRAGECKLPAVLAFEEKELKREEEQK